MNATLRRLIDSAAAPVIVARLVRESPAFYLREIVRAPGIHVYRVRANDMRVAIRHRSADVATLAEVFYHRWYDPPAEVAQALGSPRRIVDLGGNIGLFGVLAVAAWPDAGVVAYEPDPTNAEVHERVIAANGLGERWSVIRAAAGAADGEVRLAARRGPSSFVLPAGASDEHELAVPLRDVMAEVSSADLVKIDIEGGEWAILSDPRFAVRPPRVLVLEYHQMGCPGPVPRTEALRLLEGAGLRTRAICDSKAAGVGMVWAWRA